MDRIESTASKPTCETIVNVVLFVVVIAISIEYEYVVDKMLAQGSSFAGQHENVWVGTMATYLVVALIRNCFMKCVLGAFYCAALWVVTTSLIALVKSGDAYFCQMCGPQFFVPYFEASIWIVFLLFYAFYGLVKLGERNRRRTTDNVSDGFRKT